MMEKGIQTEEKEQKSQMEDTERQFSVFLLNKLYESVTKMQSNISKMEYNMQRKHKKMMEGFRCIERAFKTLSGSIMGLADDLGSATGQIASDPWSFEA